MKVISIISGTIVAGFVAMHLFNHIVSVCSAERHVEMMIILRHIYRHTFVESMLLASVAFQIATAAQRYRTGWRKRATGWDRLQMGTGAYLVFFLVIHLTAIAVARHVKQIDTNFFFGVAGINTFPLNLFFIPYYGLAVLSVFGYIAALHGKKGKRKVLGLSLRMQAIVIMLFGLLLTLMLFYGFTNQFRGVDIPDTYHLL